MKIKSITPEQAQRFGEWSKTWIEIGLSTAPANFDAATEAALKAYALCNRDRPKIILRMSSPYGATLGGAMALAMLREMKQVRSQVQSQVRSQVWSQVRSQVWAQVRSQVGSQVWSQVESQVQSQVGSQVWSQVGSQVRSQVESQVRSAIYNNYGGSLYASWGAYISFMRDVLGWQGDTLNRFEIDEALIRSCGWVWWHEDVLAISDRPAELHRDDQGRLHNQYGPSIAYRDGWQLYHWHGVAIPAEWIEQPKTLTASVALSQQNVELRRAACEMLGWVNILRDLNARTIDTDPDPLVGTLVEVDLPDVKARFLRVTCGTGREFAICVDPKVKTALQAQAWCVGLNTRQFKLPEVRT